MNRLYSALAGALALVCLSAPAISANTSLQWGVDRNQTPNEICAYDSTNNCQPTLQLGVQPVYPGNFGLQTFIALGGNTAIDLAVRFGWQLTPYDFGAVGDGVADDTASVQAWLTALVTYGGEGFCPAGKYQLTSGVNGFSASKFYHMRGAGDACNFYVNFNGWGQAAIDLTNPTTPTTRGVRAEWDHFEITYNNALTAPPIGFTDRYATDLVLHDFYASQYTANRGTIFSLSSAFNLEHVREGDVWGGGARVAQHLVPAGTTFSISANSSTLTSNNAFFSASDTGVTYACLGGSYSEVFTVTYVNSTTVTTNRNASVTHTNVNCSSGGVTGSMSSGSNVLTLSANNVPTSFVGRTVYVEAAGSTTGTRHTFLRGLISTVTPGSPETLTLVLPTGGNANASQNVSNSVLIFDPAIELYSEATGGSTNDVYFDNIHSEQFSGTALVIAGCTADCTVMRQKLAANYQGSAFGQTAFDSEFDMLISGSDVHMPEFIAEQINVGFTQILVEGQTLPIAIGNSTGLLTTGQYHVAMLNNSFGAYLTVGLANSGGLFDSAGWCPSLYYSDQTAYYGVATQGGAGGYLTTGCLPIGPRVLANGATTSRTSEDRAGNYLTPYDFASANSGGVIYTDAQRQSCTVATTATGDTATISGAGCGFTTDDSGKYIAIFDAGASLTTAPIGSATVGTNDAYTAMPSIAITDATGLGGSLSPRAGLATATLVTGGTGCPASQSITLNLAGGTSTSVATVTGTTNSSGVLTGALTVTLGNYSALPSTSGASLAANGGTTCGTYPTVSSTWSMLAPVVAQTGFNYTAPTAAYSTGAATLTVALATPGTGLYNGTITGVSGTSVTVSGTFAQTISGAHYVEWGHSDLPAINAGLAAAGNQQSCLNLPPPPPGYFWGAAGTINISASGVTTCLKGDTFKQSTILELSNATLLSGPSNPYQVTGVIEDITFDGGKLSSIVGDIDCPSFLTMERVQFNNAGPYGTNLLMGDTGRAGCNTSHVNFSGSGNASALYAGLADLPLFGAEINTSTDTWLTQWVSSNNLQAFIWTTPSSSGTHLDSPHSYNYPFSFGVYASLWLEGQTSANDVTVDGAQQYGIEIDTSNNISINSGQIVSSPIPTFGIAAASGLTNIVVNPIFNASEISTVSNRFTGVASAGSNCSGTGVGNRCLGGSTGYGIGTGSYNLFAGLNSGAGGLSNLLAGDYNVGVGAFSDNLVQGSAYGVTGLGAYACSNTTTGYNDICVGYLASTASAGTHDELNIGNLIFGNLAVTTRAPAVLCGGVDGAIDTHANAASGKATCPSGAATTGTITFNVAYQSYIHCTVTPESTLAGWGYSASITAITLNATNLASASFDYQCQGVFNDKFDPMTQLGANDNFPTEYLDRAAA